MTAPESLATDNASWRERNAPAQHAPFRVASDHVKGIQRIVATLPALGMVIGAITQWRFVIDANVVLKDLRWLVSKRRQPDARSDLQEVLASGVLVGYAPPVLRSSVRKHLPRFAAELQIPLRRLEEEWSAYEPLLHFVEPEQMEPGVFGAVDLDRDPDDVPYLQLAIQLGACGVLTLDNDIGAMGRDAAVTMVNLRAVVGLRDYARGAAIDGTIRLGTGVVVFGGFLAIKGLANMGRLLARLPWPIQATIAAGAVVALAYEPSRTAIGEFIGSAAADMATPLKEAIKRIGEAGSESLRLKAQAENRLRGALPAQRAATVATLAFSVVAAAKSPITIDEIVIGMRVAGYASASATPHAYVSRKLREDRRVRRYGDGLWGLK